MQIAGRVFNRIVREIDTMRLLKERGQEFGNDANFRPDLVETGFLDRLQDTGDDSALLERIVTSYQKAKTAQKDVGAVYQVSNEWLPIYNHNLKEVMSALSMGDLTKLAKIYKNFFRNSCSTGLIGLPVNMKKRYLSGKISRNDKLLYLFDVLCRYKLWKDLTRGHFSARSLASTSIGNPYGFELDGVFVSHGSDYLHYYATEVSRLAEGGDSPVIVELGGGYGGMAYFLLRDHARITYVDFDLPENLALTTYYLLKAFPDLKATLYGETELSERSLRESRIVLMPNFEIGRLPDGAADVVFNSYSLAEMSAETIAEYVRQLTRISRRYFLHVNHTEKSLVSADKFGIEKYSYDLLNRKQALWNRGRTLIVDEYEFLYEKSH